AVIDRVAFRQRYCLTNPLLNIGDGPAEVAAKDITANHGAATDVFAHQLVRSRRAFREVGYLTQLDLAPTVGQIQTQLSEPVIVAAIRFLELHHQIETALAIENL